MLYIMHATLFRTIFSNFIIIFYNQTSTLLLKLFSLFYGE